MKALTQTIVFDILVVALGLLLPIAVLVALIVL
jgi:hypothetical protein